MSETIDSKVKELMTVPDNEVVELALKYLKRNISNTGNSLVEAVCDKYQKGDVLPKDSKTYVCIFVAFEELTRENR